MRDYLNCAVLGLLVALAGCSTPEVAEQAAPEFAADGLHVVRGTGFEQAYVLPDAGLAQYRVLDIEPMDAAGVEFSNTNIPGTTRRNWTMTAQRADALQRSWESSMNRAFSDYDLSGTGDSVLRISARLTQVAGSRSVEGSSTLPTGRNNATTMDSVAVSAEFRMHDADSGQLLAVVRDRRTVPLTAWTRGSGANLSQLFSSWSNLLHTRVAGR